MQDAIIWLIENQWCLVCHAEPPTVAFVPCGHRAICSTCNELQYKFCVYCNESCDYTNQIWDWTPTCENLFCIPVCGYLHNVEGMV